MSIEPGSSDWNSSAPSTKLLLRTKVCLSILPYGMVLGALDKDFTWLRAFAAWSTTLVPQSSHLTMYIG